MAAADRKSGTYVALLRAINVGGRNRLPMADLVAMFEAAGCRDTRTYIQSGNVLFRSSAASAARAPALVAAALRDRLGVEIPVVVRTAAELSGVARSNPYLRAGVAPDLLHVMFLAERPAAPRVSALDPDRSPCDRFTVAGREIYLHYPDGLGRSKLTGAYFERGLATSGTARNWRTVTTLVEMSAA